MRSRFAWKCQTLINCQSDPQASASHAASLGQPASTSPLAPLSFLPRRPRLRADRMPAIMDVRSTLGAVFIGCLFSVAYVEPPPVFPLAPPDLPSSSRKSLSAVLGIQTFMFFRMYPHDLPRIKLMVRPPSCTSPMFKT